MAIGAIGGTRNDVFETKLILRTALVAAVAAAAAFILSAPVAPVTIAAGATFFVACCLNHIIDRTIDRSGEKAFYKTLIRVLAVSSFAFSVFSLGLLSPTLILFSAAAIAVGFAFYGLHEGSRNY